MPNPSTTKLRTALPFGIALIASLVAASGTLAANFTAHDSRIGGFYGWKDAIGPDVPPGLPGGFEVTDNGEEDDPTAPRAHSDVPDLPDSGGDPNENSATDAGDPQTSTSGHGLYEAPEIPDLKDIMFGDDDLVAQLNSLSEPLSRDDGAYSSQLGFSQAAPALSAIPTPGGGALLVLAGAGLVRRRRR